MVNKQVDAVIWNKRRVDLRETFTNGKIISSSTKELEDYLIVLANTPDATGMITPERYQYETEVFSSVVRHLLQVKLGEELHRKSHFVSVCSLWVSIGAGLVALAAAVFAGLLVRVEAEKHESKTSPSVLEMPAPKSSPTNTVLQIQQMPLTNTTAVTLTNH